MIPKILHIFIATQHLEIGWTVIPVIIVVGFGFYGMFVLNDVTAARPEEMVVKVTGQQWSWSFEYPEQDDVKSAALVLPVNQPVKLEMESTDVLHSFWVPEFRVKQDLVPGQVTELRFTPSMVGEYKLRCAEICGTDHALMLADVRVVDQATFATFIEESRFRFLRFVSQKNVANCGTQTATMVVKRATVLMDQMALVRPGKVCMNVKNCWMMAQPSLLMTNILKILF